MSDDDMNLTRRSFGKVTLAGLGLAGLSGAGAAATGEYDPAFRNWRAREASQVWERGYRGRPDRTVAITDSGVEARHPDLGPWNGVRATVRDGELVLPKNERERIAADAPTDTYAGTAGPGSFANPDRAVHEFTTPDDVEAIEATMTWTPDSVQGNGEDLELYLDRKTSDGWERVAAATASGQPEVVTSYVAPAQQYRLVAETWLNAAAEYEITAEYFVYEGQFEAADPSVVFDDVGRGPTDPKIVGWFDEGARYGSYDEPRDPNGHGSHCASIMAGTGRATAIDTDSVTTEEPGEVLLLGDTREYDVTAPAGTSVFASVYGTAVEIVIEGPDGRELDSTSITSDSAINENAIAEAAAETDGNYTVIVRPVDGLDVPSRVDAASVGRTEDPATVNGDRTGEPTGLHTGLAPDQSIVGLQGLSGPTGQLAKFADSFVEYFDIRAVNMSWGYTGGLPLGSAGGVLDSIPSGIRDITDAGILTVAAAGNSVTPFNGNGSPAVADEAVSVCATGVYDGLTAYSSGGIGALDEDENETYMKPDVAAPGGKVDDVVDAAKTGAPDADESEQPAIREYTGKAGTSMATPFTTGLTGLLAQAMEEDAPADVALPEPTATTFDDVMRLKQVLLATASETAFMAAPYHRAHEPTYDFGGRDPYEGYGRVNPAAAVDAVTRDITGTTDVTLGSNLPDDQRAAAGYVQTGPGTVTASVSFDYYSGGNDGAALGEPHVDLFVYDLENPDDHGEPNVVARAQGLSGDAETTVSVPRDAEQRTFAVVAKLVNVPGVVNGDDVQAHLTLDVSTDDTVFVSGSRTDDGSLFTGGQTDEISLTVNPSETGTFRDVVPGEWTVLTEYSDDVERVESDGDVTYVYFGEVEADTETTVSYLAEAPAGTATSNAYAFGPTAVETEDGWVTVDGTSDTNVVAGTET